MEYLLCLYWEVYERRDKMGRDRIDRKIIALASISLVILAIFVGGVSANKRNDDVAAVWISTIYNLDYPSQANRNKPEAQKAEFIEILDSVEELGINKLIVQVRPKADALYKSEINPWSEILTGSQGEYPGYDPLEFMIEETHKRGMTFHAWLNPYRVTTFGTDINVLSKDSFARKNPDLLLEHDINNGKALVFNPKKAEVKKHIRDTVDEIIRNYDVDGIHFDDYFYPSNYPLPEGQLKDGVECNERRNHVNEMIKGVHNTINDYDETIKFGVSPRGIWKNNKTDQTGSATNGSEAYYAVYSDSRKWIENNWVDYIVPQIYWETGHRAADYETLVDWWDKEVEGSKVELYIGQASYKDEVAKETYKQLKINEKYKNVKGSYFFSLRDILNDKQNIQDQLKKFYQKDQHSIFKLDPLETNIEAGNSSQLVR